MDKEKEDVDISGDSGGVRTLFKSQEVVVSSILKETYSILYPNEDCYDTNASLNLHNLLHSYPEADSVVNSKVPEKSDNYNENEMTSEYSDISQSNADFTLNRRNDSPRVPALNRNHYAASPRIDMSTLKQDFQMQTFQCDICAKQFIYASSLTRHKRYHAQERIHSCSECGKAFNFEYEVKNHITVHTHGKIHVCTTCDKKFAHRQTLLRHQMIHENKMLGCDQCQKQFTRKDKLERHKVVHQPKSKCSRCSKEVFHISEHLKHCAEARLRNHVCPVCDRTFLEKSYLQGHCRYFHSCDERPAVSTQGNHCPGKVDCVRAEISKL